MLHMTHSTRETLNQIHHREPGIVKSFQVQLLAVDVETSQAPGKTTSLYAVDEKSRGHPISNYSILQQDVTGTRKVSNVFWCLNLVRLHSLYKILYPKGGYNLTVDWVPQYPQIKYYSSCLGTEAAASSGCGQAAWQHTLRRYATLKAQVPIQ